MRSSIIVLFVFVCISAAWSSGITLKTCCSTSEYYDLGNNRCGKPQLPNVNETVEAQYPSVYSRKDGKLTSFKDFDFVQELVNCSHGSIVESTKSFKLYEDGTLDIRGSPKYGMGSFCIAFSSEFDFLVRFCSADPCLSRTIPCVRKCCPMGFAINEETQSCENNLDEFAIDFKDEKENPVDVPKYNVRGGILPQCPSEMTVLEPDMDTFHVLPSGALYSDLNPDNPILQEYCLDDFLTDNGTVTKAVTCLEAADETLKKIFASLMIFSSLFLIATFIVYAIIPEIRNIHGATIMCHCGSLAVAFICFGIMQLEKSMTKSFVACKAVGIIAHFAFLSTFTWLSTMSFDIWWTLTDFRPRSRVRHSGTKIGHRFVLYCIYAWSLPLIIVIAGQIVDHDEDASDHVKPGFGVGNQDFGYNCWFPGNDKNGPIWYWFYGPIALILVSNLIFFVMTAIRLHRAQRDAAFATKKRKKKRGIVIIFSLFLLMGLTWATEIISGSFSDSTWYAVPTDIVNLLNGVFIFILFVWKKKVRRLLRKKFYPVERLIRGHEFALSFSSRGGSQRSTTSKRTVALTMSQVSRDTDYPETEMSKLSSTHPDV